MTAIITAMHLCCLSLVESGDNDRAIGASGEVSRYQILPGLYTGRNPTDPLEAGAVAYREWEKRAEHFAATHKKQPTAAQLYLLWNRPAHVDKPSRRDKERAQRFVNLMKL